MLNEKKTLQTDPSFRDLGANFHSLPNNQINDNFLRVPKKKKNKFSFTKSAKNAHSGKHPSKRAKQFGRNRLSDADAEQAPMSPGGLSVLAELGATGTVLHSIDIIFSIFSTKLQNRIIFLNWSLLGLNLRYAVESETQQGGPGVFAASQANPENQYSRRF